ncbi:hypothetical protein N0V93_004859 [Gnomoniopsis smithogilvyi]|uniref:Putative phospholipase n=1 Tax=Gnomoniopsis smithogilvyi TaxID=1191159 RepID=A0A9W8YVH1_9PEZI|nr:hypothetical protein N0V93_004859 [Gnomoniopsis smithogilvyi]
MQPFDDITTPELGLEDDVLSTQPAWQDASSTRYPTPKWMRSTSTSHSALSSVINKIYNALNPLLRSSSTVLLSFLRPRFTLSYIVFSLLTLYMTHRLLTSRPLLASPLPPYRSGPYDVAAVDIEVPLELPRNVSDITFKATGKAAFEVESVLFTLYYPTQQGSTPQHEKEKLHWIPKPVSATATGYARFLGIDNFVLRPLLTFGLWLVAGDITIPARIGAPLLPADAITTTNDNKNNNNNNKNSTISEDGTLPVMVFSHGMLSSRTDYTAYLGSLASRGIVVAALEHRDGSSPSSRLAATRRRSWRYYFGLRDLDPASFSGRGEGEGEGESEGADLDTAALKRAQLAFRTAEINAAVSVLRDLNTSPTSVHEKNARATSRFDPTLFAARLNTSSITLAGHSYGGTGALQALLSSSTSPFAGGVILDPGKSSGRLNADVSVPLVICHSASWSRPGASLFYGRPHFEVVREIAEGVNERCITEGKGSTDRPSCQQENARGWFLTSLGTSHPSITDAPLLEPLLLSWTTGSTMDAADGIAQYVDITEDLVRYQHTGAREGLLELSGRDEDGVISREYDPARNMGMPERWRKYWQVHVAPD